MADVIEDQSHSTHSSLRERIVEHVFVSQVLQRLWQRGCREIEVLHSEFDRGGYDIVFSLGSCLRHVQLKTSKAGGRASNVSISRNLAAKPSGCVLWLVIDERLDIVEYRWFGNAPGSSLPDMSLFKVKKHTRANSQGIKAERPNHCEVPKSKFKTIKKLDDVLARLFGAELNDLVTSRRESEDVD